MTVRISLFRSDHEGHIEVRGTYTSGVVDTIIQVTETLKRSTALIDAYEIVARKLKQSVGEEIVEQEMKLGD